MYRKSVRLQEIVSNVCSFRTFVRYCLKRVRTGPGTVRADNIPLSPELSEQIKSPGPPELSEQIISPYPRNCPNKSSRLTPTRCDGTSRVQVRSMSVHSAVCTWGYASLWICFHVCLWEQALPANLKTYPIASKLATDGIRLSHKKIRTRETSRVLYYTFELMIRKACRSKYPRVFRRIGYGRVRRFYPRVFRRIRSDRVRSIPYRKRLHR